MEWVKFDEANPPADGQYFIFCSAFQWDAEWVDIARFDAGKWHDFKVPISVHGRVRYYYKIVHPPEQFLFDRADNVR